MNITIGDLVGHPFSPPEFIFGMVLAYDTERRDYRVRWFRSYDATEWDTWADNIILLKWKKKLADHVASW